VVPADVTNADQVTEAYETVNKAWGAVDVLVNNAGRNSSNRHFGQLTVAEMSSILDGFLTAQCRRFVLTLFGPSVRFRTHR
jgi:NADP-dependent 3-hydroxy acid dehydrogenase YdfG